MDAAITCFDLKPCGASQRRILKKLRDELQKYAAPQRHMSVVRLIVGDDNLSTEEAVQALQQEKDVKHC